MCVNKLLQLQLRLYYLKDRAIASDSGTDLLSRISIISSVSSEVLSGSEVTAAAATAAAILGDKISGEVPIVRVKVNARSRQVLTGDFSSYLLTPF